jgi:hypothetical protein
MSLGALGQLAKTNPASIKEIVLTGIVSQADGVVDGDDVERFVGALPIGPVK